MAADVFGCEVMLADVPDSAAVGAARRAAHGLALATKEHVGSFGDFLEARFRVGSAARLAVAAQPSEGAKGVYSEALVAKLRRLENAVAAL